MEEPNVTASAILSFAEKLEEDSSKFYEQLSDKHIEYKETFLSFAKESKNNKVLMTRTYQETITDALEACFSFKGLNPNEYAVKMNLTKDTSYSDALRMAMELEDKASKFYSDVAELSKPLLATIPRAFRKVAETRNRRKMLLKSLLDKAIAQG
jgi:rubrerythrin